MAPEKLKAGAACPDDFDAFWKGKLAELAVVPVVIPRSLPRRLSPGADYAKIILDNIRGTHVQGQIAHPAAERGFQRCCRCSTQGVSAPEKAIQTMQPRDGWR